MDLLLDHRIQGRRPAVALGIAVTAGLLLVAAVGTAPPVIWGIWLLSGGALLALFLANPVAGSRIDGHSWVSFSHGRERTIPLDEIRRVELISWSDGPDTCRVHLWSGTVLTVPGDCLPSGEELAEALRRAGVSVQRD